MIKEAMADSEATVLSGPWSMRGRASIDHGL